MNRSKFSLQILFAVMVLFVFAAGSSSSDATFASSGPAGTSYNGSLFNTSKTSPRIVAGEYENSEVGFRIWLPYGWSGMEAFGMTMISPEGIDISKANMDQWLTIVSANSSAIAGFISTFGSDMSGAEFPREYIATKHCNLEYAYIQINGVEMVHLKRDCDEPGRYTNRNAYSFFTEDRMVVFMFMGNGSDVYKQRAAEFEDSIRTIEVVNPITLEDAMHQISGYQVRPYSVKVQGDLTVNLKIESTANVTDMNFDEESKQFSFTAETPNRSGAFSSINLGRVLEGPIMVTVNGEATKDFVVVRDEVNKEELVQVGHSRGTHDVVISGTRVVPELSPGLLATLLGGTIVGLLIIRKLQVNDNDLA